jgi:hypothetical protein
MVLTQPHHGQTKNQKKTSILRKLYRGAPPLNKEKRKSVTKSEPLKHHRWSF